MLERLKPKARGTQVLEQRNRSLAMDELLRVVMVHTTRGMAEKGHSEQHG